MTDKKYKELKEVICKANPSIMELEFGCVFEWVDENYRTVVYIITHVQGIEDIGTGNTVATIYAQEKGKYPSQTPISWETDDEDFPFLEYAKIIGRPIQLADTLKTFGNLTREGKCKAYNPKEWSEEEFMAHNVLKIVGDWNLSKDLEHQEPEVINFLHSIICK